MRLWSLHPKYLDAKGLVALWREALLARAVLKGETRGYRQHPQLERFRQHPSPLPAIEAYLTAVFQEASLRGYSFDADKIMPVAFVGTIPVTKGQVAYEWQHLLHKLSLRSPEIHRRWLPIQTPECHPSFIPVAGPIAPWEKTALS